MDKGIHYGINADQPFVTILCMNKEYRALNSRTGIDGVLNFSSDIKGQSNFVTLDWKNVTCGECLNRKV